MTDKIKELCKQHGTSLFKLEKELGFGNGTIGKWGKGGRIPSYGRLKMVADYFGVSISDLTGEEEEKAPSRTAEREITSDDFTYAMQNETKNLTEADKQLLLSMAKQLNEARKQKHGESG